MMTLDESIRNAVFNVYRCKRGLISDETAYDYYRGLLQGIEKTLYNFRMKINVDVSELDEYLETHNDLPTHTRDLIEYEITLDTHVSIPIF